MDVFERVREVNRGAGLTEDRIAEARARLLAAIEGGAERKRLTRRPMVVIVGAVAGVAAVTAGVVVVAQLSTPAPRVEAVPQETVRPTPQAVPTPLPSPTSGTTVTEPFPGTTPQAGQYLRIESDIQRVNYRDSQGAVFAWPSYQGSSLVSALLTHDRWQLYMPADRSADWYNENGPFAERVQFFGDPSSSEEAAWSVAMPVQPESNGWWSAGGLGGDMNPPRGSTESYAQLPRDPQALLDDLRVRISGWTSTPREVDDALIEGLTSELLLNIAPPDVRKAYLDALSLSGLVQTSGASTGTIRYEYRRDLYDPRTETITVDEATGWVMEHDVRFDRAGNAAADIVPASVPDIRTTFTVSIVDSAP